MAAADLGMRLGRRPALRRLPEHGLVLAGFIALTACPTYPVAFRLATHLPGDNTDSNVFAWNLWWFRKALAELHAGPFWTDDVFFPDGIVDLTALDVRYFVLHRPYDGSRVREFVETVLPVEKVFDEDGVVAFRVRPCPGGWAAAREVREDGGGAG